MSIMTKEEMLERLGGQPSTLDALALSLEKWQRLTFGCSKKEMDGDTCALCELFAADDCIDCPLKTYKGPCDSGGHPWLAALHALEAKDRIGFMVARENLIKRLKRAIKKEQNK